jgi:hypothetical protein
MFNKNDFKTAAEVEELANHVGSTLPLNMSTTLLFKKRPLGSYGPRRIAGRSGAVS